MRQKDKAKCQAEKSEVRLQNNLNAFCDAVENPAVPILAKAIYGYIWVKTWGIRRPITLDLDLMKSELNICLEIIEVALDHLKAFGYLRYEFRTINTDETDGQAITAGRGLVILDSV